MSVFNPKRLLVAACAVLAFAAVGHAAEITGAGATFPYPIYARWADAYRKVSGVALNYQSIGSGGGIKQIKAKTVTFGASDMPLKPADLEHAGLVQFPMIIGGVVPVVNVQGIGPGQLVLDGPTIAAMYLGDIKTWNDPRIKKLNPHLALPATAIAPVYRSDGSGTNFLFTHFLSQVSPKFRSEVGYNTSVQWPVGIGAKGNEGVANTSARTNGAIGYVEYAYAKQNKLAYADLINRSGHKVSPDIHTFRAAAANADWTHTKDYYLILTDQPGGESWPIVGASFILVPTHPPNPAAATEALKFFNWAYKNGGEMATGLSYVPLPESLIKLIRNTWRTEIKGVPPMASLAIRPGHAWA